MKRIMVNDQMLEVYCSPVPPVPLPQWNWPVQRYRTGQYCSPVLGDSISTMEPASTTGRKQLSDNNLLIGYGSPRSLQLWGTIGTTDAQVLIDKKNDKEVQYYVYTLHVLIFFLKRLNDKYIKKKKMKVAMQRRL
ncbi:hypothetical protein Tco_0947410 [Tanacetum coccineum]